MMMATKLFYAGGIHGGQVIVHKNTSNDSPLRKVIERMRGNGFSQIGVMAYIVNQGRYPMNNERPIQINIDVSRGQVCIRGDYGFVADYVIPEFRNVVVDSFGEWAAKECRVARDPIERVCKACERPYQETVGHNVAVFPIKENRHDFNASFQIELSDIGIVAASTHRDIAALCAGIRVQHAVFTVREELAVPDWETKERGCATVVAEKDSPIYTFATSFAFDRFEVKIEKLRER